MPSDTNVVALLCVNHASSMSQEKGWTTDAAIFTNGVNADTDREELIAPYVSQRTPVAGRNDTVLQAFRRRLASVLQECSQAFLPRWRPHNDTVSWVSLLYAPRSFNYCTTYPSKHVCPYLIHKSLLRSLLPFLQVFFPCVLAHSFTSNLQKQWVVCTPFLQMAASTHQHGVTCLMNETHDMHVP
jgi:hypothetical protein